MEAQFAVLKVIGGAWKLYPYASPIQKADG